MSPVNFSTTLKKKFFVGLIKNVEIFISAFLAYLAPFKVKINYNITFRPNLRSGVIYLFIWFFSSRGKK